MVFHSVSQRSNSHTIFFNTILKTERREWHPLETTKKSVLSIFVYRHLGEELSIYSQG